MEEIVSNDLTHEGIRRLKVIGDAPINEARYQNLVPVEAVDRAIFLSGNDVFLGLYSLEITFPVYGPWEVFYHGPKKFRRFMFVAYAYAERVSDCIELARTEFFARTHFAPRDAYVRDCPKGAEIGMDVHDCILQVADWMPGQCVAVGGRG